MRKIILISLFLSLAAHAQQQRVAIMGTEDDGEPPIAILEQTHLTDKFREIASNILPKSRYGVMTQQSIVDRLGSQEQAAKLCREATCLADLGRKVNADYIAQARIGRFSGNLTIKVELYNVASGNLIASFTDDSENVKGLLAVLEAKAPALFGNMPGGITIEDSGGNLNITGAYKGWKLTINDKPYYSFKNRLSPGIYDVKLNHDCYEDINFKMDINNESNEIFDMANHVQWKQGVLELSAEQGGKPVSEPVYADGKRIGETPFSGYVPVCANLEIGENREAVDARLMYRDNVRYTHKMGGGANYEQHVEARERRVDVSQGEGVKFGFRMEFGIYDFSFGYDKENEGMGIGIGLGAGVRMKIPITSRFGFNTGLDLNMRNLFSKEVDLEPDAEYISEFTMSIPILIQFMLFENIPLAAGVQFDIPFRTKWVSVDDNDFLSNHRASVDLGLALEIGYMVMRNAGIDFRLVIGMTNLFEDFENSYINYKDRTSLRQYGFGWFYFF